MVESGKDTLMVVNTGGGFVTVIGACAVTPPDVAMTCVVPALTPVIVPVALIVATADDAVDHVTTGVKLLPFCAAPVAVAVVVAPA